MSVNPVSRARLFGSAAIVIATSAAIIAAFLSVGPSGLIRAAILASITNG